MKQFLLILAFALMITLSFATQVIEIESHSSEIGYTDIDTNNDGFISREELAEWFRTKGIDIFIDVLDFDHDKKISKQELTQLFLGIETRTEPKIAHTDEHHDQGVTPVVEHDLPSTFRTQENEEDNDVIADEEHENEEGSGDEDSSSDSDSEDSSSSSSPDEDSSTGSSQDSGDEEDPEDEEKEHKKPVEETGEPIEDEKVDETEADKVEEKPKSEKLPPHGRVVPIKPVEEPTSDKLSITRPATPSPPVSQPPQAPEANITIDDINSGTVHRLQPLSTRRVHAPHYDPNCQPIGSPLFIPDRRYPIGDLRRTFPESAIAHCRIR